MKMQLKKAACAVLVLIMVSSIAMPAFAGDVGVTLVNDTGHFIFITEGHIGDIPFPVDHPDRESFYHNMERFGFTDDTSTHISVFFTENTGDNPWDPVSSIRIAPSIEGYVVPTDERAAWGFGIGHVNPTDWIELLDENGRPTWGSYAELGLEPGFSISSGASIPKMSADNFAALVALASNEGRTGFSSVFDSEEYRAHEQAVDPANVMIFDAYIDFVEAYHVLYLYLVLRPDLVEEYLNTNTLPIFSWSSTPRIEVPGLLELIHATGLGGTSPANNQPATQVAIGDTIVNFEGQQPTIVDGRTLVPVRGVFEMLGFAVEWDDATSTAIMTNADYEMRITIGNNIFTVSGAEHTLDVPAQNIGGRTMVPIRLPFESVGLEVDWDAQTSTVIVTTP